MSNLHFSVTEPPFIALQPSHSQNPPQSLTPSEKLVVSGFFFIQSRMKFTASSIPSLQAKHGSQSRTMFTGYLRSPLISAGMRPVM